MDDGYDEPPTSAVNVLPGEAMADLDWDDDEESTNVFDRSGADLFAEISAKPKVLGQDDSAKRGVAKAAALLASSGRSAAPARPGSVPPVSGPVSMPGGPLSGAPLSAGPMSGLSAGPMSAGPMSGPMSAGPMPIPTAPSAPMPSPDALPRIPAPAPVPRDISESRPGRSEARPAAQHPSWHPSAPAETAKPSGAGKSTLILAAVAVLVLAAAGFFYLRNAAASTVVISVTHQGNDVEKANIYIDGQKKCEFAPCKLELKPGAATVRVTSGNLAGSQSIDVQGGKELRISIPLGVSDETAPAASETAEPQGPATVKLDTKMEGVAVQVFVGDAKEGKKLPAELTDLEPGKVLLRFEADNDKYGKLEKTVELKPGETLELNDIELPLLKVKTVFVLGTRGAKVTLLYEEDGKKKEESLTFRGDRAEIELDTSKTWWIEATLKGYDKLEQKLAFEPGKEEQEINIALQKEKEVATAQPQPEPDPTQPDKPQPEPAATASGFINANSIPPSKVIINGRPYGSTPVTGVKVPAGTYTVIFKHGELGTQSRTVSVGPGQTRTATVRFKKSE